MLTSIGIPSLLEGMFEVNPNFHHPQLGFMKFGLSHAYSWYDSGSLKLSGMVPGPPATAREMPFCSSTASAFPAACRSSVTTLRVFEQQNLRGTFMDIPKMSKLEMRASAMRSFKTDFYGFFIPKISRSISKICCQIVSAMRQILVDILQRIVEGPCTW